MRLATENFAYEFHHPETSEVIATAPDLPSVSAKLKELTAVGGPFEGKTLKDFKIRRGNSSVTD